MARDRKSDSHRKVAEAKLGRKIRPGHDVDHLNENKDDNSPANLVEVPHGAHSKLTQSPGRKSLRQLQKALAMVRKGEKSY
jgi:hypothetical protein